jgi:carboxypeptidase C (cathepsin A)
MRALFSLIVIAAFTGGVQGQLPQRTAPPRAAAPDDGIVVKSNQVSVDGRVLSYTTRAGALPIADNDTGDVHGNMFFVSYTLEGRSAGTPRPLTFLWNGGPGSSSSLVHLLGFGPRRVRTNASPVDNRGTWLEFTDLVFVDPIGTGYSRPTRAEYGPEFYQTQGDAESVAEFIRVYRNRFETWDSPVFLAGESYGVTRAAGVADVLQRRGITISGVVLIGLALPLGQMKEELRTALMLPTYTAAAFANKKLDPDLQKDLAAALRESELWAASGYAEALSAREQLGDAQRQAVVSQIARFTGLPAAAVDLKTLAVPMPQFAEQLLRDQQRVVGRYDSRLTGPFDPSQKLYDPTKDPSLEHIIDDVAVIRYLRNDIGYESDLQYQGPFGGGYPPPAAFRGDWMSVRWNRPAAEGRGGDRGRGGAPSSPEERGSRPPPDPLGRAMTANPALTVFSACGYYDLVCSFTGNVHLARGLEPDIQRRVTVKSYAGGHAIYTDPVAQLEMKRDVADFFKRTVAPKH